MNKAPLIFIGHGSPMHAIADNAFTQSLKQASQLYAQPKLILCISAHWTTDKTLVTHMAHPKTIHDFYGFPKALFDVQYPAPGDPQMAEYIRDMIDAPLVGLDDHAWGIDHGTWAVLRHMYPHANIPVIQMSLDMTKHPADHYAIAMQLKRLRDEGVLIIGSGNIVHNLRILNWDTPQGGYDWAVDFDAWANSHIQARDYDPLIYNHLQTEAGRLSVPTPDHYLPLLYVLGASDPQDRIDTFYTGMEFGSLSMRSFAMIPE